LNIKLNTVYPPLFGEHTWGKWLGQYFRGQGHLFHLNPRFFFPKISGVGEFGRGKKTQIKRGGKTPISLKERREKPLGGGD